MDTLNSWSLNVNNLWNAVTLKVVALLCDIGSDENNFLKGLSFSLLLFIFAIFQLWWNLFCLDCYEFDETIFLLFFLLYILSHNITRKLHKINLLFQIYFKSISVFFSLLLYRLYFRIKFNHPLNSICDTKFPLLLPENFFVNERERVRVSAREQA